jgi:hypothetical protein
MADEKKSVDEKPISSGNVVDEEALETRSIGKGDVLGLEHVDPVLNMKMHLVNNAIDEIGFTPYQAKLFCLNGFGSVARFTMASKLVLIRIV